MRKEMKQVKLSSLVRRALKGHSRGFTLVELLITIGLIGAISVAFFSFMSAATSALIHADERTIAESLARSQLEFVKDQGYNASGTYLKIPNISDMYVDYTIWSVNGTVNGTRVNGGPTDPIIGIPWDSTNNKTATSETGLQKVALVIEHDGKVIYTFINSNPNWANGVEITLEGYIRES